MKKLQQAPAKPAMADEERNRILTNLATLVQVKLRKSISARQRSGIETIWAEDEEFFQGIDDANRHEFASVASKPTEGGRDSKLEKRKGSTLFPNITAPYVDAAAAKMADMLLPTDDRNFVVDPTPVPDILDEEEGFPAVEVPQPAPAAQPGQPGQQPMPQAPLPQESPADRIKALLKKLEAVRVKAKDAAEKAQDTIDDHLTECNYHTELREVIHDAARLGTGVLKGPFPVKTKVSQWKKNPQTGERELVVKIETKPASRRVDIWNLFPADGCGDDIHRGDHLFERDFLTAKMLNALKGGQGKARYLDQVIDLVLEEGPKKTGTLAAGRGPHQDGDADLEFEVWHFYGEITGEELEAAGCPPQGEDVRKKRFPVILTMVNGYVIKAALNPLDTGEFPFDVLPWKKRPGMPWGTGVARQARVGQRIVVAATRNLMDNAGASAKPHKVVTDEIEQAGDPWTWRAGSDVQDVRKGMMFFVQPSLQQELQAIITMGEKMVEVHTGLPMIILGMQGDVEETAHGRALQNNNGSMVLRRLARQFDGSITEPHIRRYHSFLMQYSTDETIKGDFLIKARGSSALVERDLQNQQLPVVLNLSLQPAYELDPKLCAEEFLKSQRFNPKSFQLSDERKKELAEAAAAAPPPPMPAVEAAKLREEGATNRLNAELQDREKQRQWDAGQADLERQLERMQIVVDAQLRSAELDAASRQALDDIKANLAGITIKVRTQRELAGIKGAQALSPPTEPPGKAAPGRAFEQ